MSRSAWLIVAAAAVVLSTSCGSSPPTAPPPPPALTISCPANVDAQSSDGSPVFVSFDPPRANGGVAPVTTSCTGQPGLFNVGSTGVTCQATDARSQTASCSFVVAVRPPPRLRFTRFLSFGDSLTAGEVSFGPTLGVFLPNESYPAVLQRRLAGYYRFQTPSVTNAGVGGEEAGDGGVARFRNVLMNNRPEVVLLMEGSNDLLDRPDIGRGADRAIVALRVMIQDAKSLNVSVGLATIPPQRAGGLRNRDAVARIIPAFNDRVRALAVEQDVVLVDVYDAMKDNLSLIGVDDLHPTIMGYDVMAGVFFEAIKKSFEETPPLLGREDR
jgi:lysophospholipase L1-like esterase